MVTSHTDGMQKESAQVDPDPGPASPPAPDPGLLKIVESLLDDLRARVHDQLTLAALEAQRAGESLVLILACGVVVGVLLGGAFLVATGALMLWLVGLGVPASIAMLLGAVLMLLGALGGAVLIRRRSRALRFPATLRSLRPAVQASAAGEQG